VRHGEVGGRLDRVGKTVAVVHDMPLIPVEFVVFDEAPLQFQRSADIAG